MKLLALLGLVLAVSLATETSTQNFNTLLTEVSSQSQFGKSISSLVQMHTGSQNKGQVDDIQKLLSEIQTEMISYDEQQAKRYEGVEARCASIMGVLGESIDKNEDILDDYQNEREALIKEQNEKSSLLREEKENYQEMNEQLEQAQADQEEETSQFETRQRDYNGLIAACEAGIDLLQHMVHGEVQYGRNAANFIQLAQIKTKFASVLEQFKSHSSTALMQPVLTALVTVSSRTSINYEEFIQCLQLLQDILDRLRQDLKILTDRHNQIDGDLITLSSNLIGWIQQSGNIVSIYEERLSEIAARLAELEKVITQTQDLIRTQRGSLSLEQGDCQLEKDNFAKFSAERKAELLVLETLIAYTNNTVAPAVKKTGK